MPGPATWTVYGPDRRKAERLASRRPNAIRERPQVSEDSRPYGHLQPCMQYRAVAQEPSNSTQGQGLARNDDRAKRALDHIGGKSMIAATVAAPTWLA